jgi:uncharacterized low-complexity protein
MNAQLTQLTVLSALLLQFSAAGFAATPAITGNSSLFELTELPVMTTGNSALLAEKCGSGACGGKKEEHKATDHKCGTDAKAKEAHQKCGTEAKAKNAEQKCSSAKCGSKTNH